MDAAQITLRGTVPAYRVPSTSVHRKILIALDNIGIRAAHPWSSCLIAAHGHQIAASKWCDAPARTRPPYHTPSEGYQPPSRIEGTDLPAFVKHKKNPAEAGFHMHP